MIPKPKPNISFRAQALQQLVMLRQRDQYKINFILCLWLGRVVIGTIEKTVTMYICIQNDRSAEVFRFFMWSTQNKRAFHYIFHFITMKLKDCFRI